LDGYNYESIPPIGAIKSEQLVASNRMGLLLARNPSSTVADQVCTIGKTTAFTILLLQQQRQQQQQRNPQHPMLR
jgi:hypothetical protein